jgi:uncharacterized protein YdeI (YjbR/CyaY-like superfamily)
MPKRDPRIDAYIAKSRDFAKPILKHVRAVVHEAAPNAEETLKWGAPAYTQKGILCITAAFKEHCAFVLWKAKLITGMSNNDGMGNLGRLKSVADLPPKRVLAGYIRKAVELNEKGVKITPGWRTKPKKAARVPAELSSALKKNAKARGQWERFSPSHRREYSEWISGAKQEETKKRRLAAAIKQISAGQPQNWKYMKT